MDHLPVYKLYLMKPTLAANSLSPEQRTEYMKKHDEFMAQTGGKMLLTCDMVWSNEEFEYFGLEVFPNLQALTTYHECLRSIGWFAYFESKSYLGWTFDDAGEPNVWEFPAPPAPDETPIYKLVFWTPRPAYYEEMEKVNELGEGQEEIFNQVGKVTVFAAYSRMNNEENFGFMIERYPTLSAMVPHYKNLEFTNWFKYVDARSFLGRAVGGSLSGLAS
jgi:hypothetical protein